MQAPGHTDRGGRAHYDSPTMSLDGDAAGSTDMERQATAAGGLREAAGGTPAEALLTL